MPVYMSRIFLASISNIFTYFLHNSSITENYNIFTPKLPLLPRSDPNVICEVLTGDWKLMVLANKWESKRMANSSYSSLGDRGRPGRGQVSTCTEQPMGVWRTEWGFGRGGSGTMRTASSWRDVEPETGETGWSGKGIPRFGSGVLLFLRGLPHTRS